MTANMLIYIFAVNTLNVLLWVICLVVGREWSNKYFPFFSVYQHFTLVNALTMLEFIYEVGYRHTPHGDQPNALEEA